MVALSPIVSLKNVSRSHREGQVRALESISLDIESGELIAIVGASGSGKSTLLGLLSGLDVPTGGQVFFEGECIASQARWQSLRASRIGIIFQDFLLLPSLTALQNIEVAMSRGSRRDSRIRASRLLEQVGLAHRMSHKPAQLSGGECQRVAIARALANDPRIILADEPTGNLDSGTGAEIMSMLLSLNRERRITIILVTHDQKIADQCSRKIMLADGKLVADSRAYLA